MIIEKVMPAPKIGAKIAVPTTENFLTEIQAAATDAVTWKRAGGGTVETYDRKILFAVDDTLDPVEPLKSVEFGYPLIDDETSAKRYFGVLSQFALAAMQKCYSGQAMRIPDTRQ